MLDAHMLGACEYYNCGTSDVGSRKDTGGSIQTNHRTAQGILRDYTEMDVLKPYRGLM